MRSLHSVVALTSSILTSSILTGVILTGALCAQDKASPSPWRFVPKNPLFVARVAGPGAWHNAFAKTPFAKLMHGEAAAPLVAALRKGFDAMLEHARGSGKVDADALEKALTVYAGDAVFALSLDVDGIMEAAMTDSPPPTAGVLVLGADSHNDLAPLVEALDKEIEGNDKVKLHDLKVGERTLRVAKAGKFELALPFVADGSVVWLFGDDLEKSAPKALTGDDHWSPGTATPSLMSVHFDSGTFFDKLIEVFGNLLEQQGAPFDAKEVCNAIGFASVRSVDGTIAVDNEHLAVDADVTLTANKRGLLAAWPEGKGGRKLLAYVPAGCENFSVAAIDVGALWHAIAKVWDAMSDAVPVSREDAMKAFAESCKVRLEEDLLAHVGKEMLTIDDAGAGGAANAKEGDDDDEAAAITKALAGKCMCLHLANGAAFGESLEKLIHARGLHAARKTEEYAGTKVHRLRVGVEIEYAVTDDLLLLGFGNSAGAQKSLRAVLDERAARAAGKPAAEPAAGVKERLTRLPDGWSSFSVASVANQLRAFGKAFGRGFAAGFTASSGMPVDEKMDEVLHQVVAGIDKIGDEMRHLGLDLLVATATIDTKGMQFRLRW